MCGISGFNWGDKAKIEDMMSALSYRGPDADGSYVEDGVSLGHNRLAVIDLSADANQPMFDAAGELAIVFNGEIYNFRELKKELEGEYNFVTKSDTEVILAGYKKWGAGVAARLNGMFAFAIWDKRDSSLFCARDHAGMKPFYYFWDGQKFIFASEIRAIVEHPVPRTLNRDAFNHFLRVLYTPEPMTMIEHIYKLPPAHTLRLKGGVLSIEPYGAAAPETTDLSYPEAVSAVRSKVLQAVDRHLVADVPVGVYLSGGIDSSAVLFAMSQVRTNIQTFTIGFELGAGEEAAKFNRDAQLAKTTAEFFGTEHHTLTVSAKDVLDSFGKVVAHNSDPISNPTAAAMFSLAQFAKSKVTVALTGNGGDERFGGYDRYRRALLARYVLGRGDLFARFMFIKDPLLERVLAPRFFVPDPSIKTYYRRYLAGADAAEALMHADERSWLPDYFFMLTDKMSMASALEERMPLCDRELTAFAASLPRRYKVDLFRTKKVLKDAFKNDLPPGLFKEPKRGWFAPAAKWLRDPQFSAFAREVLSPGYYAGTQSLFNWDAVAAMLEDHISKKEYNLTLLWALITFQSWAKEYRITL